MIVAMKKDATKKSSRSQNTQIIGIRMTPEMSRAFKAEAAKRGLRANQLFTELWKTYQQSRSKTS